VIGKVLFLHCTFLPRRFSEAAQSWRRPQVTEHALDQAHPAKVALLVRAGTAGSSEHKEDSFRYLLSLGSRVTILLRLS
jgi:hypothetical protein